MASRDAALRNHAEFDLVVGGCVVDSRQRLASGGFDPRLEAALLDPIC